MRRAKEADYEGVAGIRGVIIPVGMSGASGFLGGKVVIDDPNEAKRRLLMAKVLLVRPGCYDKYIQVHTTHAAAQPWLSLVHAREVVHCLSFCGFFVKKRAGMEGGGLLLVTKAFMFTAV